MKIEGGKTSEDMAQWIADNERLVLAGLSNTGPGPIDYDEKTVEAVRQRCVKKFGDDFGNQYFVDLIATLPERHKELFPEIFG